VRRNRCCVDQPVTVDKKNALAGGVATCRAAPPCFEHRQRTRIAARHERRDRRIANVAVAERQIANDLGRDRHGTRRTAAEGEHEDDQAGGRGQAGQALHRSRLRKLHQAIAMAAMGPMPWIAGN
jgi:hypothetical protein